MRVGVTGASGLIGRSLVEALHERGDTVVAFARPASEVAADDVVRWDPGRGIVDEYDLKRVGRFDCVVNLAGAGIGDRRWSDARKKEILDSRVLTTTLLVRVLSDGADGGCFLANASAIGVYGSRAEETLDETSSRGEGFLSDVCRAWESAAAPLESLGVGVAYLRSGVVLSLKGGALKKQLPFFRSALGGNYGSGRQWMSVISLFDEVRALLWSIDHRVTGPINLVAPTPLTNGEFARSLASILGRPALLNVPRRALEMVLGPEMANDLVLASQRVVPAKLLNSGFAFEHGDAATALRWAINSTR